ncbi:MAG TPA: DNA polymerase IV [Acidimicrobiales bacterium]|nr:DNA polymerase IV [Acidimicrobiales bacterium]
MSTPILHVDMDAFFVAVELRRDPSLVGRPVVVGGTGNRGVVASCSYEARAYGIHSAMPTARARRLCPRAVFLPGRFDDYLAASADIHRIFLSFTPLVEGVALDEAFLDVSGAVRLFGAAPDVARVIRQRVHEEMSLDCSVGVARSKLVAKLASKAAKPRATPGGPEPGPGVVVVRPEEELVFLHPKPVTALWGVGPATAGRLARMAVTTIGDLAAAPVESLVAALGSAAGRQLHELAWGRDPRRVEPWRAPKSVGHEETYAHDHHDHEPLRREVVRMADAVAGRLRNAGLQGRTVTLKVRFGDFSTITRSHTAPAPVDTAHDISRSALALLEDVDVVDGVRLLGVSVTGLSPGQGQQLTLDDWAAGQCGDDWDRAAEAVDEIRRRFGDGAVGPAALAGAQGLRVKRLGDTQWGPAERGRDHGAAGES